MDTGIVVTSTPANLDDLKSLIVIDDSNYISIANGSEHFTQYMVNKIGYFDQIPPKLFFFDHYHWGIYKKPSRPTEKEFEKVI